MHPNNSTAFHACIQKNTASTPLFHSFHGFHGQARTYTYTQRKTITRHTFNYLAHVTINRVHSGMSGINGSQAGFRKTAGGMPWKTMETSLMAKPLRQTMPFTTAIIDDFRLEFPEAEIEKSVRAGIDGQPTFYAKENGHSVGTPLPYDATKAVSLTDVCIGPLNRASAPQNANSKGKK